MPSTDTCLQRLRLARNAGECRGMWLFRYRCVLTITVQLDLYVALQPMTGGKNIFPTDYSPYIDAILDSRGNDYMRMDLDRKLICVLMRTLSSITVCPILSSGPAVRGQIHVC